MTDKDKRAIYESVMSYFKEEILKRLNEAYDRKLAYLFNNKSITPYDVIRFDEEGKVEIKRLNNQWLGSITDDGCFVLEVGKTYSYKDVFKRIDDEFNREYSKSLLHIISLIAKMWNMNITDWIWNDHSYNQSIKLNKETFDAKVTRIVKTKNGRVIDFDFVINKMELVRKGVSSEFCNILCGDSINPSNLKAIVYLTIDMYNKLANISQSRYDMKNFKEPLLIASNDRYSRLHKYDDAYEWLKHYIKWCENNVRNSVQYEIGKYWDEKTIQRCLKTEIDKLYNKDNYNKTFFRWLKKKDEELYKKLMYYINLD